MTGSGLGNWVPEDEMEEKKEGWMDEDGSNIECETALTTKEFSPLVIRKITKFGFPMFIGIITDDNIDGLDMLVINHVKANMKAWKSNSIQDKRNLAGQICELITEKYEKTEGVGITFFIDKCAISSLFGDMMNHLMCRYEYYTLLHMSTGI